MLLCSWRKLSGCQTTEQLLTKIAFALPELAVVAYESLEGREDEIYKRLIYIRERV
jgi:hypothetical protein